MKKFLSFCKKYNWGYFIGSLLFTYIFYLYVKDKDYFDSLIKFLTILALPSIFITCKAIVDINQVRQKLVLLDRLIKFKEYDKGKFKIEFEKFKINSHNLLKDLDKLILVKRETKDSEEFNDRLKEEARACFVFIENAKYVRAKAFNSINIVNENIEESLLETSGNITKKQIENLLWQLEKIYTEDNHFTTSMENSKKAIPDKTLYGRFLKWLAIYVCPFCKKSNTNVILKEKEGIDYSVLHRDLISYIDFCKGLKEEIDNNEQLQINNNHKSDEEPIDE